MMDRRLFLVLIAALLAPLPAWAKDGADDSGGSESGSDSSGSDDDGGSDNSGPGNGDDSGNDDHGGPDGDDNGNDGPGNGEDDHDADEVRRAVSDDAAVPLKDILESFSHSYSGSVVDIQLLNRGDELRYRVKFIDGEGRVLRAYFDAVTGAPIR